MPFSAVSGFYEFQERNGTSEGVDIYRYQFRLEEVQVISTPHHKSQDLLLKLKEQKFPGI